MAAIDTTDSMRQVDKLNQRFKAGTISAKEYNSAIGSIHANLIDIGKSMSDIGHDTIVFGREMVAAFKQPISTLSTLTDKAKSGLDMGKDLGELFGSIAGLFFGDDEVKVEEEHNDALKKGNDSLRERQRILGLSDDCSKLVDCEEEKNKKLLAEIKNQGDIGKKQKDVAKTCEDLNKTQKNTTNETTKQIDKGKILKRGWDDIVKDFKSALDRFVELDKAAAEFRKEIGLTGKEAERLSLTALEINQQFVSMGVSIADAYKAMSGIASTMGTALLVNKENAETVALLAANYGVLEKHGAGFYQKMTSVGNMTDAQAKSMAGLTANLSAAAGVNIDEVMDSVANASGDTLSMMRGNVKQMTFAAIQAKQLGVSLDKSASAAKSLLNFSQSVSDEMEASILLGRNLNLNYARQLSFQGDISGAQKEILNQVRSMGDFNKMNLMQQDALAKAAGYTVDELSKMLKNEEKLGQLTEEQRTSYDKALASYKEQNEETGKDLLMKTQMQSVMKQLSNILVSFKQIAADILTPVVMVASKLLIPLLKGVLLLFNLILIPVKIFGNLLYKAWTASGLEAAMQWLSHKFDSIIAAVEMFSNNFDSIEKAIKPVAEFAKDIVHSISKWAVVKGTVEIFEKISNRISSGYDKFKKLVDDSPKFVAWLKIALGIIGGIAIAIYLIPKALGSIKGLLDFRKYLKLPSFLGGKGGVGIVENVKKMIANVADAIKAGAKGISSVISSIANAIKQGVKFIGELIVDMAKIAKDVLIIASEAIEGFSKGFGAAIGFVGKGIGVMIKGIGSGLKIFASPQVALGLLVVTAAIIALAIGIALALRIAGPILEKLAKIIGVVVISAINALKEVVVTLIKVIGPELIKVVMEVVKIIGGIFLGYLNIIKIAIILVKDVIVALVNVIGGVWIAAINAAADVIVSLSQVIGDVLITGLNTMKEMFLSLPTVVSAVSDSLWKIAMAAPGIALASLSIGTLTASLLGMSAALGGGGVGAIAGIFVGDPIKKLEKLAAGLTMLNAPAEGLAIVSQSISSIFSNFSELDIYTDQLSSFSGILHDIASINFDNLDGLEIVPLISSLSTVDLNSQPDDDITNQTTTTPTPTGQILTTQTIVDKLDELIDLMASGGIAVNLDGRKVSEQLAIASY